MTAIDRLAPREILHIHPTSHNLPSPSYSPRLCANSAAPTPSNEEFFTALRAGDDYDLAPTRRPTSRLRPTERMGLCVRWLPAASIASGFSHVNQEDFPSRLLHPMVLNAVSEWVDPWEVDG